MSDPIGRYLLQRADALPKGPKPLPGLAGQAPEPISAVTRPTHVFAGGRGPATTVTDRYTPGEYPQAAIGPATTRLDSPYARTPEQERDEQLTQAGIMASTGAPEAQGEGAIARIAKSYRRAAGVPEMEFPHPAAVNKRAGHIMADTYHNLVSEPNNPEVQAAYAQFARENEAQAAHLRAQGYRPEFVDKDPYKNSREMLADLRNKKIKVFRTAPPGAPQVHPVLTNEQNDTFRWVHDVMGHGETGEGFGPHGEEKAYRNHAPSYSPAARRVLATETRGQNSWFNYGPHKDLPVTERPFAEQKAALWPEHLLGEYEDAEVGHLANTVAQNPGGFTLHGETARPLDKPGYLVTRQSLTQKFTPDRPIPDQIREWWNRPQVQKAISEGGHIGGWQGEINVTEHHPHTPEGLQDAHAVGRAESQQAIGHMGEGGQYIGDIPVDRPDLKGWMGTGSPTMSPGELANVTIHGAPMSEHVLSRAGVSPEQPMGMSGERIPMQAQSMPTGLKTMPSDVEYTADALAHHLPVTGSYEGWLANVEKHEDPRLATILRETPLGRAVFEHARPSQKIVNALNRKNPHGSIAADATKLGPLPHRWYGTFRKTLRDIGMPEAEQARHIHASSGYSAQASPERETQNWLRTWQGHEIGEPIEGGPGGDVAAPAKQARVAKSIIAGEPVFAKSPKTPAYTLNELLEGKGEVATQDTHHARYMLGDLTPYVQGQGGNTPKLALSNKQWRVMQGKTVHESRLAGLEPSDLQERVWMKQTGYDPLAEGGDRGYWLKKHLASGEFDRLIKARPDLDLQRLKDEGEQILEREAMEAETKAPKQKWQSGLWDFLK